MNYPLPTKIESIDVDNTSQTTDLARVSEAIVQHNKIMLSNG